MRRKTFSKIYLSILTIGLIYSTALAEIDVNSVVVIANKNSQASVDVAIHYLNKRKLSKKNLIKINSTLSQTVSRKEFDSSIKPQIKKALIERGIASNTRVLVTTFDTPIRVASPDSESDYHIRKVDALRRRDLARATLFNELQNLKKLAAQNPVGKDEIKSDVELLNAIQEQIKTLISNPPAKTSKQELTKFLSSSIQRVAGAAGLSTMLRANNNSAQANEYLNQQKQILDGVINRLRALEQMGASKYRKTVYNATAFVFGLRGVLSRANTEAQLLSFEQADASFDSELSLLWWDTDMYPLSKRLPNPWFIKSDKRNIALPIIMVSRLDGPSHEIAKKMVDDSIYAEQNGLTGKFFVDARGLKTPGDEFFTMDSNLRDFGWSVRNDTDYKVYIENHEGLLNEAKNAALYVGWYSVGKFVGDFSFTKGAMGYHIASSEAITVRDEQNTGWCKNLLQRGVVATLGPVDEPYLDSFPQPLTMFGLMMTGRYTLAESYYLSSKYLSWRMVLFGDPLYNPWRKKPAIKEADLELPVDKLPQELGQFDIAAAYSRKDKLAKQREKTASEIDSILAQIQKRNLASKR